MRSTLADIEILLGSIRRKFAWVWSRFRSSSVLRFTSLRELTMLIGRFRYPLEFVHPMCQVSLFSIGVCYHQHFVVGS